MEFFYNVAVRVLGSQMAYNVCCDWQHVYMLINK